MPFCTECGRENPDDARFCSQCGAPAQAEATPEMIKLVTIMFADIVGSTELIRDRDPEEAQRLLDGVVQIMMDAVHRYEAPSAGCWATA